MSMEEETLIEEAPVTEEVVEERTDDEITFEKPEWLKEKYNTVEDQAKAYGELEKKFGGFTGAPDEDYELTVPEGINGEFDMEDPRIGWFQEVAKNSNMSQETFTQMLHGWVQQETQGMEGAREAEIEALGTNAQNRLKDLGDWGAANLKPEEYEGFKMLASTAAGVQTLEALVAKTQKNGIANVSSVAQKGINEEMLKERIADPRYQESVAFRKETEKMFNEFYN